MEESTTLSKSVSVAYKFLWEANIDIEDAILAEIKRQEPSSYNSIISALENSVGALELVDHNFEKLSQKMDRLHFVLKPAVINFEQTSIKWEKYGYIANDKFWKEIISLYKEGGFRNAIGSLRNRFVITNQETRDLLAMIKNHKQSAANRLFMADIEENKIPLRQHFARVLTCWDKALSLFRYSSLISTELYLRDRGYPQLAEGMEETHKLNSNLHHSITV